MSDTITSLVARVVYLSGAWLYVVHETTDSLFGVKFFNNDTDNAAPEWATVPRANIGESPIHHPLTVVAWWPDVVATFLRNSAYGSEDQPRVSGDQDTDQAYRRGVVDGRAEEARRSQAALDVLVSDAHEYANNNNLCSEFDRFMEEHGLPGREREYVVTLDVSTSVTVTVTASDDESAGDEALERFNYSPRDFIDWGDVSVDINDVEAG